jgi:gliding motility-associated-like protein
MNEQYFDAFNTSDHPTNYNGQTKVMTAKSVVEPGVLYHIKLVVADQGNRQYDSAIFLGGGSFKIQKDLGDDRLIATSNPLCFQTTLDLDATEPGTNTYQWFKNDVAIIGATNPIYQVSSSGNYSVEINLSASGCISAGEISIEYAAQLTPSPATIVQCDPDFNGVTLFNLTNTASTITSTDSSIQSIEYFENNLATVQISNPASYNSVEKVVYAKVYNSTNCFEIVPITLTISNQNPTPPSPISFCDDTTKDGIRTFDLSTEVSPVVLNGLPAGLNVAYFNTTNDALNSQNPIPNSYTNTTVSQQTIWAKITNGPDCYGIIPVTLVVNFLVVPNFDVEEKIVCEGLNSISLSVPTGFQTYLWNDANASTTNQITVTTAGTYVVTVTDANGCSDSKNFIIKASGVATITGVTISDFNGGNNTVTIDFTGSGDYEFSLGGNYYQDDPIFYGVASGTYEVYVRDKNECGKTAKEIFVLDYPKYFTPNGDGYNDVWKIDYLQKQNRLAQVRVFDRYGKLVFSGTGDNNGWNGTLNSYPLPASDYWFSITLENKRVIKGHFSLKR